MHKFSIVIPTYNRSEKLARAISSVGHLDYKSSDFELIVVDDGSTDDTDLVVDELKNKFNFTFYKLESNKGVGYARNFGIARANNDWIILLDSDNQLVIDALLIFNREINSNKNVDLIFSRVRTLSGKTICPELDRPICMNYRLYLNDKLNGEWHTATRRHLLTKHRFLEEVNGGEGVTWGLIMKDIDNALMIPFITLLYDDLGNDRLSNFSKNFSRLKKVYEIDIAAFRSDYVEYAKKVYLKKQLKYCCYKILTFLKG